MSLMRSSSLLPGKPFLHSCGGAPTERAAHTRLLLLLAASVVAFLVLASGAAPPAGAQASAGTRVTFAGPGDHDSVPNWASGSRLVYKRVADVAAATSARCARSRPTGPGIRSDLHSIRLPTCSRAARETRVFPGSAGLCRAFPDDLRDHDV